MIFTKQSTFFAFNSKSTFKSTHFLTFSTFSPFSTTTTLKPEVNKIGHDQDSFFEAWQARDGSLALIAGTKYENRVAAVLEAEDFTVEQQKGRIDLTVTDIGLDVTKVEVKSKKPFTFGETTLVYKKGIGYVLNRDAAESPHGALFARVLASDLPRVALTRMSKKVRERNPEIFDACRLNHKIFNGEPLPCMLSRMLSSDWKKIRTENPLYADNYFALPNLDDGNPDGLYGSNIIRQFYVSKGCSYIQIEGKGVYLLGPKDPLKTGAPLFDPSVDTVVYVRVRVKIVNFDVGGETFARPQIYVSFGIYSMPKFKPSDFCLVYKRDVSKW